MESHTNMCIQCTHAYTLAHKFAYKRTCAYERTCACVYIRVLQYLEKDIRFNSALILHMQSDTTHSHIITVAQIDTSFENRYMYK